MNKSKFILISSFSLLFALSINLFIYYNPNFLNFDQTKLNKKFENIFKEKPTTLNLLGIDKTKKIVDFSSGQTNNVLIIGNSHAQDLFIQLKILEKEYLI